MTVNFNKPKSGEDLVSVFNSLKYTFGEDFANKFKDSDGKKYAKYCATIQKFARTAVEKGWGWYDNVDNKWKELEVKYNSMAFPTAETVLVEEKQKVTRYSFGWLSYIMQNKLNPQTFV